MRAEDEESGDESADGAEDEEDDGDALAGARERVGDGKGFGFVGFVVEPGGDQKDQRRQRGEDVVLLPGGETKEEQRDHCPKAEKKAGVFRCRESADGDERAEGFAPGDRAQGAEEIRAEGHEPDEE